jgi:hypothetical protein
MTPRGRAAKRARPSRCWVCLLPSDLRSELDEMLRNREFTKAALVRTLRREGYPEATRNRINYHIESGHHELRSDTRPRTKARSA